MLAIPSRGLALAIVLSIVPAAGATPVNRDGPRKESSAEVLRKSLEYSITLELTDAPLANVLIQLADMAKVNIVLDRGLVLTTADPADLPVTIKAKDMPLRVALRTITGQHGLTFAVVSDHVFVSHEDTVNSRQLRQRVSLNLEGVPLGAALRDLAQQTATNLVIDPRSAKAADAAKVTLKLDDVPLETAVRIMAEMAGLKPARLGNVLFVTLEDRAEKIKAENDAPPPVRVEPSAPAATYNPPMVLPPGK